MMSNYDWIKPGVKARVIHDDDPLDANFLVGQIVTITSEPYTSISYDRYDNVTEGLHVDVEEGFDLSNALGEPGNEIFFQAKHLEPYKDDGRDLSSWDKINDILKTDIRGKVNA